MTLGAYLERFLRGHGLPLLEIAHYQLNIPMTHRSLGSDAQGNLHEVGQLKPEDSPVENI